MIYKLGKHEAKPNEHLPKLASYLNFAHLPTLPKSTNWRAKLTKLGYMLNNRIGNCVVAGYGHIIQTWTANAKTVEVTVSNVQILKNYSALSGYNPQTGANDNGCNMQDACNRWLKHGLSGHKVDAFATCNIKNPQDIKVSTALFGHQYIGIALPNTAYNQIASKKWTVVGDGKTGDSAPGSWGGHCVEVIDYDDLWLYIVTWSKIFQMSWDFYATYCDEAYTLLSEDWINAQGISPSGFNLATLKTDLQLVVN